MPLKPLAFVAPAAARFEEAEAVPPSASIFPTGLVTTAMVNKTELRRS
jgi:hypothetical protein